MRGYFFMPVEGCRLMRAFAKEVMRHGIRVNAILPGSNKTRFAGALFSSEEIYNAAMAAVPMHRHAQPREMAGTVRNPVSDAASHRNRECVVVDGGLTI